MRKLTWLMSLAMICLYIISSCKTSKYSESRNLLKEYAFCKCLEFAYGDRVVSKNDISINVYRDIARYNFQAYDAIDSLSRTKALAIPPPIIVDQEGKKSILLHCFRYYHSKELDSFIRTLDKEITGWQ